MWAASTSSGTWLSCGANDVGYAIPTSSWSHNAVANDDGGRLGPGYRRWALERGRKKGEGGRRGDDEVVELRLLLWSLPRNPILWWDFWLTEYRARAIWQCRIRCNINQLSTPDHEYQLLHYSYKALKYRTCKSLWLRRKPFDGVSVVHWPGRQRNLPNKV